MTAKRQIDNYSTRCAICNDAVELVEDMACSSCEITIKDMTGVAGPSEAKGLETTPKGFGLPGRLRNG
ncbi:MAG: hypothetical protein VYE62_12135 [Pseudomonadota bacterium]|nr:hypothetical protein [Pseudomonadota bacterium]